MCCGFQVKVSFSGGVELGWNGFGVMIVLDVSGLGFSGLEAFCVDCLGG